MAPSQTPSGGYSLGGLAAHVTVPSVVGPTVALLLVHNRIYWRIRMSRTIGLDDICIFLSLVFLDVLAFINLVAVGHGYGLPSHLLPIKDLVIAMKMFYLMQVFYKLTIYLTKLSILALYLRVFTATWFVRTCWILFVFVSLYSAASILSTIFQCSPVSAYWEQYITATLDHNPLSETDVSNPSCINRSVFWFSNALVNILTDFVILTILPFMIWSLDLPRTQKLGLILVFGLGSFAFAASILRMTTLAEGAKAQDPMVQTLRSAMWAMIEASLGAICACLPMCRTPLLQWFPKFFRNSYDDTAEGGTQEAPKPEPQTPDMIHSPRTIMIPKRRPSQSGKSGLLGSEYSGPSSPGVAGIGEAQTGDYGHGKFRTMHGNPDPETQIRRKPVAQFDYSQFQRKQDPPQALPHRHSDEW